MFSSVQQPFWKFNPVDKSGCATLSNDRAQLVMTVVPAIVEVLGLSNVDQQLGQKPLQASRRLRKGKKRYQKEVPGERVQMDVCKIAPLLYTELALTRYTRATQFLHYTAIDDCTRVKVVALVALYPNKKAHSTLAFLEQVIETFPFPIQRLQTDRGEEFMAHAVQQRLMDLHIKFRPTKPRSPHLNGKVERTQRTDLKEFYSQVDLKARDLPLQLQQWQDYYNLQRRHGSLNQAPWQKWLQRAETTPSWEQVIAAYDPTQERIRDAYYLRDIGRPKKGHLFVNLVCDSHIRKLITKRIKIRDAGLLKPGREF
jgi:transposase InsO family protein